MTPLPDRFLPDPGYPERPRLAIRPDEVAACDRGVLVNFRHGLTLNFLETERWGYFWRKTWWEGQLDPITPLMWQDADGRYWMPDRHEARTDLGSIPPPIQSWFPPTEMPYAYYFHDSGYRYGGLWVAETLDGEWRFERLSRSRLDDMCLSAMPEAAEVVACRRGTIWGAVRMFGGSSYARA
jgi:hypothetical protein